MSDDTDRVLRALVRLQSVEAALERLKEYYVPWTHVEDFHQGLDHLGETGEDVAEFRVGREHRREPRGQGGHPTVDKELLRSHVDAALRYFTLRGAIAQRAAELRQEPVGLIGFAAPPRR